MKPENQKNCIVGLDIGSQNIMCVVAQPDASGRLKIRGFSNVKSQGVRDTAVIKIQDAVEAITIALNEAKKISGIEIERVATGIGGSYLHSLEVTGVVALRGNEVRHDDIETAYAMANSAAKKRTPENKQILKAHLQEFILDGQRNLMEPEGLSGKKLEAHLHVVYGSQTMAQNLNRCLQRANVELSNYEPQVWASARAILTEDEKECGTLVIDFGESSCSMVVFSEGKIRHTSVNPWGSKMLTRDLASYYGISLEKAEEIKVRDGTLIVEGGAPTRMIALERDASGTPMREVPEVDFVKAITPRMIEILKHCVNTLEHAGVLNQFAQVYLTGGGSNLKGIDVVAQQIFSRPVRIGVANCFDGYAARADKPEATTAVGLVLGVLEDKIQGKKEKYQVKRFASVFEMVKGFFIGNY